LGVACAGILKELAAEEKTVSEEVKREVEEAGRMIRRFEMEASMGPWIK
jgi:hypothetical protein